MERDGIPVSTAQYRAPEVAFGDVGFGRPIDMWSLGVVVMNMCGQFANMVKIEKYPPRWGYLISIAARWLGAPPKDVFQNFPMPPPKFCYTIATPVLDITKFDDVGLDFTMKMLEWNPDTRITAEAALSHELMRWDACRSLSAGPLQGKRHPWNLVSFSISEDVLEWLRSDPLLEASNIQESLGLTFNRLVESSL